MLQNTLASIGMDAQEAKVYLFLISEGNATQQVISDRLQILRQTVYDLVKKMEAKGYVSISMVGKRKTYISVEPKLLLQQLREKEECFIKALPELEKLRKKEHSTSTSYAFSGMSGLKNLFNLTLESSTEVLWIANKQFNDQIFKQYYWHNYAQKRIERRIPTKLLIEPTRKADWNTNKKAWRETRTHPIVKDSFASFVLFEDKVIIYSPGEYDPYGMFIQNQDTKDFLEKIFFKLWSEARSATK